MSLESKIDVLIEAVNAQTKSINAFNGNIEKWLTSPVEQFTQEAPAEVVETQESEPEQSEKPEANTEQSLTHKDVQDAVLAFVRKDVKVNKPKVKALLDEFSANKVGDLPEQSLVEFKTKLDVL